MHKLKEDGGTEREAKKERMGKKGSNVEKTGREGGKKEKRRKQKERKGNPSVAEPNMRK